MEISFNGAAQTVTGSKHLITLWDNEKILLDCGMYQGMGKDTHTLNKELGFDPKDVNHLILSHAHIDHSGLIPKMVKDGFVEHDFVPMPLLICAKSCSWIVRTYKKQMLGLLTRREKRKENR